MGSLAPCWSGGKAPQEPKTPRDGGKDKDSSPSKAAAGRSLQKNYPSKSRAVRFEGKELKREKREKEKNEKSEKSKEAQPRPRFRAESEVQVETFCGCEEDFRAQGVAP